MKTVILISGGVYSSSGKGSLAISIVSLLRKYNPFYLKIDPYLNLDAGQLSPKEHGEVFVTSDGYQGDLDLGTYQRICCKKAFSINNLTGGQWIKYQLKISKNTLGKTLRLLDPIESLSDQILNLFKHVAVIEWGGSVDDKEAYWIPHFIKLISKKAKFFHIHLSPLILNPVGEIKTKPIQASMSLIESFNLFADLLVIRCSKIEDFIKIKDKITSLYNQIPIIAMENVDSIYRIPELLLNQAQSIFKKIGYDLNLDPIIKERLAFEKEWNLNNSGRILLFNKYDNSSEDIYKSLFSAIDIISCRRNINYKLENAKTWGSDKIELNKLWLEIIGADKVILPGGFGKRGTQLYRLITAIAIREKKPLLGICWGFQVLSNYLLSFFSDKIYNSEESSNVLPFAFKLGAFNLGKRKIWNLNKTRMEIFRNKYHLEKEASDKLKNLVESFWVDSKNIIVYWKKQNLWATQFHPEFSVDLSTEHPILLDFLRS